jgi:peptidoglycan/LPS O-acetylase OafA/YrhL
VTRTPSADINTGHRSDIDGLRSLAIIPVLLYHTGFTRFHGGFVGVDVFFVISGYLIAQILHREIQDDRFSLLRFYDRRIRRIFPALFVVVAFTLVAAEFFLLPSELVDFGHSIESAILFFSNMYFLSQTDYFNVALQNSPLLHTWSLAVEEQYYIFFPLLLYALRSFGNNSRWLTLAGVAALSFAASVVLVHGSLQQIAFYSAPARAWELLAGALLAIGTLPVSRTYWLNEAMASLGVMLILGSSLIYSQYMAFPGAAAVAPCLGAMLIIYAGQSGRTLTGRILSTPPLVFTGLISYSLYLWHWPIIVFAHLELVGALTTTQKLAIIVASYGVATASWKFVETPFRLRRYVPTAVPLRVSALAGMALFTVLGAGIAASARHLPWFPQDVVALSDYIHYDDRQVYRRGQCFLDSHSVKDRHYDAADCAGIDPDRPNILIVGNSHAAHLWKGLAETRKDIHFLQATASGCKPVLGTHGEQACIQLVNRMFFEEIPAKHPAGLLLSADWQERDIPALVATVDALAPQVGTVYVSGPIVEYEESLPRILAEAELHHDDSLVITGRRAGVGRTDDLLRQALVGHRAIYLSPYSALCPAAPERACTVFVDGHVPVQWDYGHLTAEGSIYLASILGSSLERKSVAQGRPMRSPISRQ